MLISAELTLVILLTSYLFLVIGIYWMARKRADYCHHIHTISQLAANNSQLEKTVSYGVFFPFGLAALTLSIFGEFRFIEASFILVATGLSYLLSAFFPCDDKTPAIGSWKNAVHNIMGAGCYAVILYQLNELIDGANSWSILGLAQVTFYLLSFMLLCFIIGWPQKVIGLLQRLAELFVFLTVAVSI